MSVRLSVSVVCGLCVSCDDEVNLLCVLIPGKESAQVRETSFRLPSPVVCSPALVRVAASTLPLA